MKNILLLGSMLICLNLIAQKDSITCKTIFLVNDLEISATIDSFEKDFLIYSACPDTNFVKYNIPANHIKMIRDEKGRPDLLFAQLIKLQADQGTKVKNKPIRNWLFKSKAKKMVRSVSEGYTVKVIFFNSSGAKQKVKGRWKNLTNEELIIETKPGTIMEIPRDKIGKITIPKTHGRATAAAGAGIFAAGAGIGLAIVIIFISAIVVAAIVTVISLGTVDTNTNTGSGSGAGCLISLLLIIVAVIVLIASKPKTVEQPFSGDWEIVYPSPETNQKDVYITP